MATARDGQLVGTAIAAERSNEGAPWYRRAWPTLALDLIVFAALTGRWWTAAATSAPAGNHPSDARLHVWILAWVSRALATEPAALFDAPIFYPAPAQLTGSEHFLSSQLVFAPIFWLTGNPVLAANALVWLSYPLAAFAMERFLVALGLSRAAAWASGLAFALGPLRVPASLQVPQLLNLYFPVVALALHRLRDEPAAGRAAIVALAIGLALFSSYYVAAMTAAVAAVWTAVELARREPGRLRFVVLAATAALAVGGLATAFSRPYFERAEPHAIPPLARSVGERAVEDGATPALEAAPSPVPWSVVRPLLWPAEQTLAPLLAASGVAALLVAGTRKVAAAGLAFVALGAGSILWLVAAGGMSPEVERWLGFFRHAYRTQLLTGFGVALLIGAAIDACRRVAGHTAGIVAALATVACILLQQGTAVVTPSLDRIALEPGEASAYDVIGRAAANDGGGAALELPITGPGGGDLRPRAMLGALRHRLPLVNGFSGHLPPHFLVINNRTGRLPDAGAVDDLVDLSHLRWILLRPEADWSRPEERGRFRSALAAHPGAVAVDIEGFTLIRLARPPQHPDWFAAVAAGRDFANLPIEERRHLEPWALRRSPPAP